RGGTAGPKEFLREVVLAHLHGEEGHLEELRRANPEHGALIDRIVAASHSRPALDLIAVDLTGKTFQVPGGVPPEDLTMMLANVGISSRWSAIYTPNNGPHAAFIRVQLRSGFQGRRTPTLAYVNVLRRRLQKRYPTNAFFFETGGMIRRILNNGAVAP